MLIIEPGKQDKKLKEYLDAGDVKRLLIVFFHGIGDCMQFASMLDHLRELWPDIKIDIGLQAGLDEEVIFPDAVLLNGLDGLSELDYDLISLIHFPVEIPGYTKSELCCIEELGIPLMSSYKKLEKLPSKLCAVHFNLTCLPDLANPDHDTAEQIWNDILKAGWIPIETHFEHVFHNPKNAKFDFVDCTVRRVKPQVRTLIGLLEACGAFVGVVSGPFHTAMSCLPHEKIAFLEKEIPVARFTHEDIKTFDIKNYQANSITEWLTHIS
jgi:hypothetical protein